MITPNCPLTKDSSETKHLFDEKRLQAMKKGAYLVSTARGAIVERDALARIMENGHLGG